MHRGRIGEFFLITAVIGLLGASSALANHEAEEVIELSPSSFYLEAGQSLTFNLGGNYVLRAIRFEAESQYGESQMWFLVNRVLRSRITVPRVDPLFQIHLDPGTETSTFELRRPRDDERARLLVRNVSAVVRRVAGPGEDPSPSAMATRMEHISDQAVRYSRTLRDLVQSDLYAKFLEPVIAAGIQAGIAAKSYGSAPSATAITYYKDLLSKLDEAQSFLRTLLPVKAAAEPTAKLLQVRLELERALR